MSSLLSKLLAQCGLSFNSSSDPLVAGVTEDSRQVQPGWLFVAVSGTNESGLGYVDDAIRRGAVAVIAEQSADGPVPVVRVPDARAALADLAAAINDFPSRKLTSLGVTGTDGKTTTSFLVDQILRACGHSSGLLTTVEARAGGHSLDRPGRLTTPSAPFIQSALAAMVAGHDQYAVIECSSHALEQSRLRNVSLSAAAITNIASDHVEYHGTQEAYVRAKSRIADLIAPQSGPELIVNGDDPVSLAMAESTGRNLLRFGLGQGNDLRAVGIRSTLTESSFTVQYQDESNDGQLPLGGKYNIYNALAATGLSLTAGVTLSEAVTALKTVSAPPGRLERIVAGQNFSVFIDYAHTEQAFGALLEFMSTQKPPEGSSLIAVFGAAGGRDRDKRPALARLASKYCDYFVITNEDPFGESPEEIVAQVVRGADPATRTIRWDVEMDRRRAIRMAFERARSNDVVVITGKGHETSIVQGKESLPWSDLKVARELLAERNLSTATS